MVPQVIFYHMVCMVDKKMKRNFIHNLFIPIFAIIFLSIVQKDAVAQSYPTEPVTIILPFGAGSVTDLVTRLLAEHLRNQFNQQFIVVNKPGAGGTIGSSFVAKSLPNGYTLLFTTNTTHSVVKSLYKNVPYNPNTDFSPVARVAGIQSMLVINSNLPIKNISEFVEFSKNNPNKIRYSFGNSSGQIAGETLNKRLGIEMIAVPYRSNPQAIVEIIGGNIEGGVIDLATGIPHIKSGKLRPLAILTNRRSSLLPDVPTINENVAPGFDLMAWFGVFAPAGTSPQIINTLSIEIQKFLLREDVKVKLNLNGVETFYAGPKEFSQFLINEEVRWTQMATAAGIAPE